MSASDGQNEIGGAVALRPSLPSPLERARPDGLIGAEAGIDLVPSLDAQSRRKSSPLGAWTPGGLVRHGP